MEVLFSSARSVTGAAMRIILESQPHPRGTERETDMIEETFQALLKTFADLREKVIELRLALVEDKPQHDDSALLHLFEDAIVDLLGNLEEASIAATEAHNAAGEAFDLNRARLALTKCQKLFVRLSALCFSHLLDYERLHELSELGAKGGGEWLIWTKVVRESIGRITEPLREVNEALLHCWQDLAECSLAPSLIAGTWRTPPELAAPAAATDADLSGFLAKTVDSAFDWYKQADAKAQAILGFTGIYLSIVVGSLILKHPTAPQGEAVAGARLAIWIAVILAFYLLAVGCCISALWSRGILRDKRRGIFFFGWTANFATTDEFLNTAKEATSNPDRMWQGWAEEALVLARNTRHKHRLVNFAVLCSGAALCATIALGLLL